MSPKTEYVKSFYIPNVKRETLVIIHMTYPKSEHVNILSTISVSKATIAISATKLIKTKCLFVGFSKIMVSVTVRVNLIFILYLIYLRLQL